ncbi:MAG TPA: polymer-forming cytoskeletal protein [Chloroflexota bacterium]|nr:polymer-forming cytoskeletal protein [Chloroflexota bacterium]
MSRTLGAALLALALVVLYRSPAHALERRSGEAMIVAAGEVVDDDLAASGRLLRIDGTVRGDVYAVAQHITIAGIVEGDVIALAQQVVVDGQVFGDVRAAGATVDVNGVVARNVSGAAQRVTIGSGGRVGGSVASAAETLSVSGDVGGALASVGEDVILQGRIGRRAELATERITLGPSASIGGDLTYHSERPIELRPGAVSGQINFRPIERPQRPVRVQRNQWQQFGGAVGNFLSLTWLTGSALVGLAMLRLFPRFVARYLDALERNVAASLGVGAIALVGTLPLAILLAITIVGLPAAAVLAGGWFTGLFVGWLLLAVAVGGVLIGLVRRGQPRRLAWSFLLGLVVLYLATRVPFVGPFVGGLGMTLGLGALVIALYRTWQRAELERQTLSPALP